MNRFTVDIVSVRDETHDVKTFRLSKPDGFSFISGQYCLISIPKDDSFKGESRPFTFANSPNAAYLELTIKKMGDFTKKLFTMATGDQLEISSPKGHAYNFDDSITGDVVFIAGGSGITPFMSAIRYAKDNNLKNQITLIYANQAAKDIIYHDELAALAAEMDTLTVVHILSRDPNHTGEQGRISPKLINTYISGLTLKQWYLCGPPKMIQSVEDILEDLDVEREAMHIESWQMPGKQA